MVEGKALIAMGKQINYFMDYDSFLLLAQKAVDLGCTIIKQDLDLGKIIESDDIHIIAPYSERFGAKDYYFHLPKAGGGWDSNDKRQGAFRPRLYGDGECGD